MHENSIVCFLLSVKDYIYSNKSFTFYKVNYSIDLSTVYPASLPMTAGIGSSPPQQGLSFCPIHPFSIPA